MVRCAKQKSSVLFGTTCLLVTALEPLWGVRFLLSRAKHMLSYITRNCYREWNAQDLVSLLYVDDVFLRFLSCAAFDMRNGEIFMRLARRIVLLAVAGYAGYIRVKPTSVHSGTKNLPFLLLQVAGLGSERMFSRVQSTTRRRTI